MRPSNRRLARLVLAVALMIGVNTAGHPQARVRADFEDGNDSPHPKGMPRRGLEAPTTLAGHRGYLDTVRKAVPSQSEIYVVDTAIVRSTTDTTKHIYSYDERGLMTRDSIHNCRTVYTYDGSGHLLTVYAEEWAGTPPWYGVSSTRYTYDGSWNLKTVEVLKPNPASPSHSWFIESRTFYAYDGSGHMLTREFEFYDFSGHRLDHSRDTCAYDAIGLLAMDIFQRDQGAWMNVSRTTYAYDGSGHLLTELTDQWTNGQWVTYLRGTCTYDGSWHVLTELTERWTNGQWVDYRRGTYSYDGSGNVVSWQHESWQGTSWTRMNGSLSFGDSAGNSLSYYGYSVDMTWKLTTIIQAMDSEPGAAPATWILLQNYPNPFNPSTTIRYTLPIRSHVTLTVYNALGQKVRTLADEVMDAGNQSEEFDASGLASGVYLCRLQAGSFIQTRRMILAR